MNLLIVFAFAGDSTMTRFLAIAAPQTETRIVKIPPARVPRERGGTVADGGAAPLGVGGNREGDEPRHEPRRVDRGRPSRLRRAVLGRGHGPLAGKTLGRVADDRRHDVVHPVRGVRADAARDGRTRGVRRRERGDRDLPRVEDPAAVEGGGHAAAVIAPAWPAHSTSATSPTAAALPRGSPSVRRRRRRAPAGSSGGRRCGTGYPRATRPRAGFPPPYSSSSSSAPAALYFFVLL